MKQKKLLPEYLGLPLILGCSSESLERGKLSNPEAKTALELLRLSARSFLQMRFRFARSMFRKVIAAGDGQKSRARDARV